MAMDLFTIFPGDVAVEPSDVIFLCNIRIHK
jgi:hypothetical protein